MRLGTGAELVGDLAMEESPPGLVPASSAGGISKGVHLC